MINEIKYILFICLIISHAASFAQQKIMQSINLEPGSSITIKANSINALGYQWYRDGILIEKATQDKYTANRPGLYQVIAINKTCTSEISEGIRIIMAESPAIDADISIVKTSESKDLQVDDPFEYLLSITNNSSSKATQIAVEDMLPEYMVLDQLITPNAGSAYFDQSSHTIKWTIDELAKSSSAELRIRVKVSQGGLIENTASVKSGEQDVNLSNNTSTDRREINLIKVPNVITPNGDGLNDQLKIAHIEQFEENELTIINRWGSHVYEKKNYKNDWNGEGLDEGTYYYLLKVRNKTGNWQIYKGYVMLLRSAQ